MESISVSSLLMSASVCNPADGLSITPGAAGSNGGPIMLDRDGRLRCGGTAWPDPRADLSRRITEHFDRIERFLADGIAGMGVSR